jgi:hypothetical protein
MTEVIAYETEIQTQSKSEDSSGSEMKNKREKLIGSSETAVEKDALKYVTKLIDNIEAFSRDLNPQILEKETGLSQKLRLEENK